MLMVTTVKQHDRLQSYLPAVSSEVTSHHEQDLHTQVQTIHTTIQMTYQPTQFALASALPSAPCELAE